MNNENWDLVLGFTSKHWPITDMILGKNTRLQEDLGIRGDDANEFIFKFAENFNLDVTNFDLSNYFTGNDFDFISPLIRFFKRQQIKMRRPLTLQDLEEAVNIGRLDDSIILSKNK